MKVFEMSLIRRFIIAVLCVLNVGNVSAQEASPPFQRPSAPTLGGSSPRSPVQPPSFGPRGETEILRHRGLTGKPCLSVAGFARPHIIDRKLYDHVITA